MCTCVLYIYMEYILGCMHTYMHAYAFRPKTTWGIACFSISYIHIYIHTYTWVYIQMRDNMGCGMLLESRAKGHVRLSEIVNNTLAGVAIKVRDCNTCMEYTLTHIYIRSCINKHINTYIDREVLYVHRQGGAKIVIKDCIIKEGRDAGAHTQTHTCIHP
jgi:hypothetical protein